MSQTEFKPRSSDQAGENIVREMGKKGWMCLEQYCPQNTESPDYCPDGFDMVYRCQFLKGDTNNVHSVAFGENRFEARWEAAMGALHENGWSAGMAMDVFVCEEISKMAARDLPTQLSEEGKQFAAIRAEMEHNAEKECREPYLTFCILVKRLMTWSYAAFGNAVPWQTTLVHLREEVVELEEQLWVDSKSDRTLEEGGDVVMLAIAILHRQGFSAAEILEGILAKLEKNHSRDWTGRYDKPEYKPLPSERYPQASEGKADTVRFLPAHETLGGLLTIISTRLAEYGLLRRELVSAVSDLRGGLFSLCHFKEVLELPETREQAQAVKRSHEALQRALGKLSETLDRDRPHHALRLLDALAYAERVADTAIQEHQPVFRDAASQESHRANCRLCQAMEQRRENLELWERKVRP